MLKHKQKRFICATALALTLAGIGGYNLIPKMNAGTNNNVPQINAYQKGNDVKVELGIDMADEDILTRSSLEPTDARPSFTWQPSDGNQSFSTDTAYSGSYSEKLTDTMNSYKGNYFSYPSTNAQFSFSSFSKMYAPNGTWFSASYKLKATNGSNNSMNFIANTGHPARGIPIVDYSGNQVKYKNTVDWNTQNSYTYIYTHTLMQVL